MLHIKLEPIRIEAKGMKDSAQDSQLRPRKFCLFQTPDHLPRKPMHRWNIGSIFVNTFCESQLLIIIRQEPEDLGKIFPRLSFILISAGMQKANHGRQTSWNVPKEKITAKSFEMDPQNILEILQSQSSNYNPLPQPLLTSTDRQVNSFWLIFSFKLLDHLLSMQSL